MYKNCHIPDLVQAFNCRKWWIKPGFIALNLSLFDSFKDVRGMQITEKWKHPENLTTYVKCLSLETSHHTYLSLRYGLS